MLNKTARNVIFIVAGAVALSLVIYLIAAAAKGQIKYDTEMDTETLYRHYGAAGMIYLMDKNSIPVDEDYRKQVKKSSKELIDGATLSAVGSSDIAKMICMDRVFGFGMEENLYEELYKRIDEKTGLLDENYQDSYSGLDEDTVYAMKLASTDAVMNELDSFGIADKGSYDSIKALADAYNSSMDKYDHNDIYKSVWTISSELENIFYYYMITDRLSLLDYKVMWDRLGSDYVRNLFETNADNKDFNKSSATNISAVLTDTKARLMGADIKIEYTAQEYYNTFDTPEAFLYNTDSEDADYFEYYLFVVLSQPSDLALTENSFFTGNVQGWLNASWKEQNK